LTNVLHTLIMKKSDTILFVLKLSKFKTTGFYTINTYVHNSELIRTSLNTYFFLLYSVKYKNKILHKIFSLIKAIYYSVMLVITMIRVKPKYVYFTISPSIAFVRDLLFVFLIKLFNTKQIYHIHGKGIYKNAHRNNFMLYLYNWAYRGSHLILLSEKLVYDVSFLPFKKYFIVPNAIRKDTKLLHYNKRFDQMPRIIFLSNIILSKGVLDFIESMKILDARKVDFEAVIVGGKGDLDQVTLIKKIGVLSDKIKYLGPKYGDEKNKLLINSDIFIFPTYYPIETWGLVILEAMQAGLPVITTNEGAITDMIEDGINGFIVEKKNPVQIAEKTSLLIGDPELMEKMSENNRVKYENNFTLDIFEKRFLKTLELILKS